MGEYASHMFMQVVVTIQRAVNPFKIYMCTHTHIHTHVCTHAHTHTHTHTHTHPPPTYHSEVEWISLYVGMFLSRVLQHGCIMYTYIHSNNIMHTHSHVHPHTTRKGNGPPSRYVSLCFSMHACTCTHLFTHTYTHTHIHHPHTIPLRRGMDFLLGMLLHILSVLACVHACTCHTQ